MQYLFNRINHTLPIIHSLIITHFDSVSGFHGVHGPQTVHRPRYKAELKDPVIQAAKSMGYKIVDPNAYSQRGKYAYT